MTSERGAAAAPPAPQIQGHVDRFTVFRDAVSLSGWAFSTAAPIEMLEIRPADFPRSEPPRRFRPIWLASPDVAAVHGPAAAACRFDGLFGLGMNGAAICGGTLAAVLQGGETVPVSTLGAFRTSAASEISEAFFASLPAIERLQVLEVGSRARSGITRRDRMPPRCTYTGCDIMPGENVDVVCDAHDLSHSLPHATYNAVFAISVLEHLLMPWKFVIELNKVMAPGGIGMFATHQCWPIHDAPWDFWRFSDQAWHGLLNEATGFEVLRAAMGEPAHIVAADCHRATNFGSGAAGFLASNVLFRKIGDTALTWNVSHARLADTAYPA